jgi:tetratricopeptide (TPR) repeat protein
MLGSVKKRTAAPIPGEAAGQRTDYRALGDQHRDGGRWRDAAESYGRYLDDHPDDSGIWVQRGNCLKEAGELARSLEAYRAAEERDPKNFDVHLQMGHLYKVGGRLASALASYETAARLNPDFGEVQHEIQTVRHLMKQPATSGRLQSHVVRDMAGLLALLKFQRDEDDVFASYFRSINGR